MMTIFWAVTPLTSSIFATARVTLVKHAIASTTESLIPFESQASALTTGFLMTAYGIVWLEQALPSFASYDGALRPFVVHSADHAPLFNATWTTTTTMYKTTLACEPAIARNSSLGMTYGNKAGCIVELVIPATTDPTALYIGWNMDEHVDYALSQMGCSSEIFSHTFLAYFSKGVDSTVLFCEPSYWMQQVNATIQAIDMTVLKMVPLNPPEPLPDTLFNISNFEYVIGTGAVVKSQRADISETVSAINQKPRLQDISITGNLSDGNMVGYAFGLTRFDPAEYLNSSTLSSSFEKAHQLLFSLAIGNLLSTNTEGPQQRHGSIQSHAHAIFVVRTLALLLEGFLGLVAILTIALLYTSWVRPSQLRHDPACIDDLMSMVNPDLPTSIAMEDDKSVNEVLHTSIEQGQLHFRANTQPNKEQNVTRSKGIEDLPQTTFVQASSTEKPPIRPLELRLIVAAIFIIILMLAAIVLVALHFKAHFHFGLSQPTSSTIINQLLTNYLPVVFATFLEPFWLLLNRTLCVLRPFEELRTGNARPSRSLKLRYTSLPPQLVGIRALRARHFLLTAICAVGISANLLSVALSGLFQTSIISISADGILKPTRSPIIEQITTFEEDDLAVSDPFYIAKANITDGTALPAFLSQDRVFMPFDTNDSGLNPLAKEFQTETQAFGAKLTCVAINYESIPFIKGSEDYGVGVGVAPVVVPRSLTRGHDVICNNPYQGPAGGQNNSEAALEVITSLSAAGSGSDDVCATLLLIGFLRANLTVSSNNVKTDNSDQVLDIDPNILVVNSLSSLWMVCQPTFLTAPYSITVDDTGRIKDYTQVGPYASDTDPYFSGNATVGSLFNRTGYLWGHSPDTRGYWHNDTFVDTWFAYYIKHLTNSTLFIDPTNAVPTFDAIVPVVEEVYARLFAIILSMQPDWFRDASENATMNGKVMTTQSRIFLSRPAYIITVTLLGFNILVAIGYYAKRPKRMLRRMPTTIASVLELFDGSGLVKEARDAGGLKEEWKLGYGRFVGTDGKPKLGIERRPFVTPWRDGPR